MSEPTITTCPLCGRAVPNVEGVLVEHWPTEATVTWKCPLSGQPPDGEPA